MTQALIEMLASAHTRNDDAHFAYIACKNQDTILSALRQAGEAERLRELRNAPVIEFLLGQGPLHGCHFGEKPDNERGNFWWRRHLRQALEGTPDD
jgi:hypothetical protein